MLDNRKDSSTLSAGKYKGNALGPDWSIELNMQGKGLPEVRR